MTKYAITATATTAIDVVEFDESTSYETIKEAIGGGTIQCIHIPSLGVDMWIDDEGKLVEDPEFNTFGTTLWINEYGLTDVIVGDIIITGGVDDEGKTLGMTKEQVREVMTQVQLTADGVLSALQNTMNK